MRSPNRRTAVAALASLPFLPGLAHADKSVRMIVGFGAGGTMDILAREVSVLMSQGTGQTVIVENRTGANGQIAAQTVAAAPADGSVLYVAASSTLTLYPLTTKGTPYEQQADFVPLGTIARAPLVLCVAADNPANSLADFVKSLRSASAPSFGSAGAGQTMHVAGLMLQDAANVPLIHVPYKGEVPALTELIGGRISFVFATASGAVSYIKGGRIKALAVADSARSPLLPNVPTTAEGGLPQIELAVSYLVMVRKSTPPAIAQRLEQELHTALVNKDLNARITAMGISPQSLNGKETDDMLRREASRFKVLVDKFKITAE